MTLKFQDWLNKCNETGVLTKKIILCSTKSEGQAIIEDFCKNTQDNRAIMNIEVMTPQELATKVLLEARKYLAVNLDILDREECAYLIKNLVDTHKLQCPEQFPEKASDATYQAVYNIISEIKLYRGDLHKLPEEALWKIFLTELIEGDENGFYAKIRQQGRFDKVSLLEEAILHIKSQAEWTFKKPTHIAGIEGDRLSVLDKELIQCIAPEGMDYLKPEGAVSLSKDATAEAAAGKESATEEVAAKEATTEETAVEGNTTEESTVEESAIEQAHIEIWKNYGEENELQRVIKDIMQNQYSFDDVAVVCANQQSMVMLQEVCAFYDVPVKFPGGFAVTRTNAMSVLYALYEWCTSMYDLSVFEQIIRNSNFAICDEDAEGTKRNIKRKLYKQARRWGNGYGIQWYANYAAHLKEDFVSKNTELENSKKGDTTLEKGIKADIAYSRAGYEFYTDLTRLFGKDGKIELSDFYGELQQFLAKYAQPHNSKEESIVFKCIQDKFYRKKQFFQNNPYSCASIAEAMKHAIETAENINVDFRANADGITCHSLQNLRVLNQSKVYICGLTAQDFPGKSYESPFLSDWEKQLVYGDVAEELLSVANEESKKRDLHALVEYCSRKSEGRVVLSYSAYDVVAIHDKNPATILREYAAKQKLELEQLPCVDYTQDTLPNLRTALVRNRELMEYVDDWNISSDANIHVAVHARSNDGEENLPQIKDEVNTNYNRHDKLLKEIFEDRTYRFSATSMNVFLDCILQYYYRYIAGVSEEDKIRINPHTWLESVANHKGNFAHYIMEAYVQKELVGKTESDVCPFNEEVFSQIFDEHVKLFSDTCPAPREVIDQEKAIYEERLKSYLRMLHEEVKAGARKILAVEYVYQGEIAFRDYNFLADVRIDRIDLVKVEDAWKIQVVDYKTGDQGKLKKKCEQGYYPQHFYYEMAIINDADFAHHLGNMPITIEDFAPAVYIFLYEEDGKVEYIPVSDKAGDIAVAYAVKRDVVWNRVQELLDYIDTAGFWLSEDEEQQAVGGQPEVEEQPTADEQPKNGEKHNGRYYKGVLCKDCYAFANQVCGHCEQWKKKEKEEKKS